MTIEEMLNCVDFIDDDCVVNVSEIKKMLKRIIEDEGDCERALTCLNFK